MKNSCASRELSVGELARRAGVAVSALHFYETKGLISSQRNAGNQRRFSRETLRRVVVIKVAQRVGIPLAEIARALQTLPAGRSPSAADWARLSAQWKEDLTERIDKLLLLRDQLDGCIGCGCLSLRPARCATPATSFPPRAGSALAGRRGPRARRLGSGQPWCWRSATAGLSCRLSGGIARARSDPAMMSLKVGAETRPPK